MRLILALAALALPLAACQVEQTEEGEMPEVEGGNLPEYDVDPADVEVGTTERTVETPDIDISTEEQQVEVPTVDVDPPENEPAQ
ncbi:MAG: hypothetical protein ABR601_08365 [Parasphingopyxis sp.]